MEIKEYRHRNKHTVVHAVKTTKENQKDVAAWCKGITKGRQSKRVIILSEKDGSRTVPLDWWVVKIFDSYVTLKDSTFWYIFETEEKYQIRMAERQRIRDGVKV